MDSVWDDTNDSTTTWHIHCIVFVQQWYLMQLVSNIDHVNHHDKSWHVLVNHSLRMSVSCLCVSLSVCVCLCACLSSVTMWTCRRPSSLPSSTAVLVSLRNKLSVSMVRMTWKSITTTSCHSSGPFHTAMRTHATPSSSVSALSMYVRHTLPLLKPFNAHCCYMGTALKHPDIWVL